MKLATPRWWYVRDKAPGAMTRMLLTPISWAWAWATARRIAGAEPVDPGAPVISIGNLTVGGSGKTPVAREVLRLLREAGVDAHGLSRGYGGKLEGPVRVDAEAHTAADVGDEPLMLARDGAMWVSRDRVAGAAAAVAAGAQAVVLDDGHQNPTLEKALSLVVVDGETRNNEWPFGDGAVVPAGPMREPLHVGLGRAHAVILLMPSDLAAPDPDLLKLFGPVPVLVARLEPAAAPPSGPLVGFAGVAKPWKVLRSLKAAGAEIADFAPFPDHGEFRESDLQFLARRAADDNATLVTTEKDWARLPPAWRARVTAWPVRARFEDEAAAKALLLDAVRL